MLNIIIIKITNIVLLNIIIIKINNVINNEVDKTGTDQTSTTHAVFKTNP